MLIDFPIREYEAFQAIQCEAFLSERMSKNRLKPRLQISFTHFLLLFLLFIFNYFSIKFMTVSAINFCFLRFYFISVVGVFVSLLLFFFFFLCFCFCFSSFLSFVQFSSLNLFNCFINRCINMANFSSGEPFVILAYRRGVAALSVCALKQF